MLGVGAPAVDREEGLTQIEAVDGSDGSKGVSTGPCEGTGGSGKGRTIKTSTDAKRGQRGRGEAQRSRWGREGADKRGHRVPVLESGSRGG